MKCGDETIENCDECGIGEYSDRCAKCEDKYFPVLENYRCIPCNDTQLGQVGCDGSCDGSDFFNSRMVYCDVCKEGYINITGICIKCNQEQPFCELCNYDEKEGKFNIFRCTKCVKDYVLDSDYLCKHCLSKLCNCKKCHVEENKAICDECFSGYQLTPENKCVANEIIIECPENCLKCEYDSKNNKDIICLSFACPKHENKGKDYSCIECEYNQALIENLDTNIKYCYYRKNNISYCTEGTMKAPEGSPTFHLLHNGIPENYVIKCTKCVNDSYLDESDICICNNITFGKFSLCIKCNNITYGNPGCELDKGCQYIKNNDHLFCNKCIKGYFEFTPGQCYDCSKEIKNCNKCHFDEGIEKTICDECESSIDIFYPEAKQCLIDDCEEYPDISPGCIICKSKLNEYKSNKKCQMCKYGYFKTKEETCVYCNTEKYGGPSCYECGYEVDKIGKETDKIICKVYYPYYYDDYNILTGPDDNIYYNSSGLLISDNKCYYCGIMLPYCNSCEFKKNNEGAKYLICKSCIMGYYLNDKGICIRISSLITPVKFCEKYKLTYQSKSYRITFFNDEQSESIENEGSNIVINSGSNGISSHCTKCYTDYYLDQNECKELNYEMCSFISFKNLLEHCINFCSEKNRVLIIIPIMKENNKIGEISIFNYDYDKNPEFSELINNINENPSKFKTCLNNEANGDEYSPINLRFCKEAYFFYNNNTYKCIKCINNYFLKDDNICYISLQTKILEIEIVSFNELSPKTMIKLNNIGIKFEQNIDDLEGCLEAEGDSFYVRGKYNCTKCSLNYLPFYSKFYDRIICQNVFTKIITEKKISLEPFNKVIDRVKAINGACEKNYFFTPDGNYCYKCDDESVGMPGCNGACTFSLKRYQTIMCEGECKKGYIKYSEGVCAPCSSIYQGCHECHYNNYIFYDKIREPFCDKCEGTIQNKISGICETCSRIGLNNCAKCANDPNYKYDYICTECNEGYFVNEKGKCEECNDYRHFQGGLNKNKCVSCSNVLEGGINKCQFCESENGIVKCIKCLDGYILSITNNTCLKIAENEELQNNYFLKCYQLIEENNKLECIGCNEEYTLVKTKDNKKECIYIPQFYNIFLKSNYFHDNKLDPFEEWSETNNLLSEDYFYNKYKVFYPCKQAINLGTEDNPLYSCIKCHEELEFFDKRWNRSTKITEEISNLSYCIFEKKHIDLENCREATFKFQNGIENYNCTECYTNYNLTLKAYNNKNYCKKFETKKKVECLILFCDTCEPNDGYICIKCLNDFVLNSATGSCVEKTEVVPAVTWKDIFRLTLNGQKTINYKRYIGPMLELRGITTDTINTRHGILIYLIYKLKYGLRNLEEGEEKIEIPTICEIKNAVDNIMDDISMVEYECIGNTEGIENLNFNNYELDNIEERNSSNNDIISNLNELVAKTDLNKLETKLISDFTYEDLFKIILFKTENPKKINEPLDLNFTLDIEGKLSKDLYNLSGYITPIQLEFENIDEKVNCSFKIGENKNANLNCNLSLENLTDMQFISIKTNSIIIVDYEILFDNKFNKIELIHIIEGTTNEIREEENDKDNGGIEKEKEKEKYINPYSTDINNKKSENIIDNLDIKSIENTEKNEIENDKKADENNKDNKKEGNNNENDNPKETIKIVNQNDESINSTADINENNNKQNYKIIIL